LGASVLNDFTKVSDLLLIKFVVKRGNWIFKGEAPDQNVEHSLQKKLCAKK
jgi:hypothetical protein